MYKKFVLVEFFFSSKMKKCQGHKSDLDKVIIINPTIIIRKKAVSNHSIALSYAKKSMFRWIKQLEETRTIETNKYIDRTVSIANRQELYLKIIQRNLEPFIKKYYKEGLLIETRFGFITLFQQCKNTLEVKVCHM